MSVATQLEDLQIIDHVLNGIGPHIWRPTVGSFGITGVPGRNPPLDGGELRGHLSNKDMIRLVVCNCGVLKYHLGEFHGDIES